MSEPNENSLDRHFESQVRMLSDVYANKIGQADNVLIERWLQRFRKVARRDKYARNCLILLMYGQLREMGKLGMPFTNVDNANRQLEEVLNEYQGNSFEEQLGAAEAQPALQMVDSHGNGGDAALNRNPCSDRVLATAPQLERPESGDTSTSYTQESSFERLTQQNRELIREISMMHARTLENEQRYRKTNSDWERRLAPAQMTPPPKMLVRSLLPHIERGTLQALRCLKDWTVASGPLNFLSIALQDVLDGEPETRRQLSELDGKLECLLDNMLEQAGERREKNVRMLYDQLFKQQQEALQAKQELLRHEQRDLTQARKRLHAHIEDLRQREQIFWRQQGISTRQSSSSSDLSKEATPVEEPTRTVGTSTGSGSGSGSSSTSSAICGCSDCQDDREQLSTSTSIFIDQPMCEYCVQQSTDRPDKLDDEFSSKC